MLFPWIAVAGCREQHFFVSWLVQLHPHDHQAIAARIRRLPSLAMGLRKEHHRLGGDCPMTLEERYSPSVERLRAPGGALRGRRKLAVGKQLLYAIPQTKRRNPRAFAVSPGVTDAVHHSVKGTP
jgi:hypothetical protein